MTIHDVDGFVAHVQAGYHLALVNGTDSDVAKAVVFLASDNSSCVNGTELFVDGEMGQT